MLTRPPVSLCGQLAYIVSSYKCCKSLIGAFKPEKAFVGVVSVIVKSLSLWGLLVTGQTECKTLSSPAFTLHNECRHFPYFLISAFHNSRNPSLIEHCFKSPKIHFHPSIQKYCNMGDVIQKKYLEIFEASYMMPGARVSLANNT